MEATILKADVVRAWKKETVNKIKSKYHDACELEIQRNSELLERFEKEY